jgi:hypothetical protein
MVRSGETNDTDSAGQSSVEGMDEAISSRLTAVISIDQ